MQCARPGVHARQGTQSVDARQVDHTDSDAIRVLAGFTIDRDARPIPDLLARPGQGIEKRRFATVWISGNADADRGFVHGVSIPPGASGFAVRVILLVLVNRKVSR